MSHLAIIPQLHASLDNAGYNALEWEIRSFPTIASTSTRVADMLGLYEKVIVISQSQSEGRGRNNKLWYSPPGGLWLSFGLCCDIPVVELSTPLIETAHRVLRPLVDMLEIKAPNDLLIDNKKVCGLLVETKIKGNHIKEVIIGIGINVFNQIPEEVKDLATRLKDYCDPPPIHNLASNLLLEMLRTLGKSIPSLELS